MKTKQIFSNIHVGIRVLFLSFVILLSGCTKDTLVNSQDAQSTKDEDLHHQVEHIDYDKRTISFSEFKTKLRSYDQQSGIDGRSPDDLSFILESNYIVAIDTTRIVEFSNNEISTYTFSVTTRDQSMASFTNLIYAETAGEFSYTLVKYIPTKEWIESMKRGQKPSFDGEMELIDKFGSVISGNNSSRGCSITAMPIILECYGSACPCSDGNGTIIGWQFSISCGGSGGTGGGGGGSGSGSGSGSGGGGGSGGGNGNLPTDPLEWDLYMFLHNLSSTEDFFYLDNTIDPHPNFEFSTLQEVEDYIINDNVLETFPPIEAQDGSIITELKYSKPFGRQLQVLVKQTLCNNSTGQDYQMHQITANLIGSQNFGATWETNIVNYNVVGDEVTINIYGYFGFGASALGIPFGYRDHKHFRIRIGTFTGFPRAFDEMD